MACPALRASMPWLVVLVFPSCGGSSGQGPGVVTSPDGSTGGSSGSSSGGAPAEQAQWLDPMNAARAAVGEAPFAWDPIAAQVAQAWASQCAFNHNPGASADYARLGGKGSLGENISAGAPTQSVAAAISSWLSEKGSYDHATNSCAPGKTCGHYTQIVWASTTAVGCAKVSCTRGSPFGAGSWDLSVCDFSPAGNFVGQPPY